MGRRMGGMRYLGNSLFGSKSLNRRTSRGSVDLLGGSGRRGFDSLTEAAQAANRMRGGQLNEGMWEEYYTETIDAQKDKAGNSGQETLLGDDYFGKEAKQFCRSVGTDYDPQRFISSVKDGLGDDYYNAISEIIEECSIELVEAWDRAYSNDGVGEKLFGGSLGGGGRRQFADMRTAFASYSSRATKNYGANWNSHASAVARNRETATKFLSANPRGTARSSFISSSYRSAAAKNGRPLPP